MHSKYHYRPKFYFLLTFAITFIFWFIGAYYSFQEENQWYMILMLLGLIAPFVISLTIILKSKNTYLKEDFINRLINIKLINIKLLPIFFLIMPLTVIASIFISLLFGEPISQFYFAEEFSFSTGALPVLLLLLLAAVFEELGWRGYAFDSLASKYNYFIASFIFSVLWSFWHFPLLFVNNSYQYEILNQDIFYALNFYVSILPMGIIISWICIKHQKSILAAILFHFIINISQEALSMTQFTKCIESIVLIIITITIVIFDKELFFSTSSQR